MNQSRLVRKQHGHGPKGFPKGTTTTTKIFDKDKEIPDSGFRIPDSGFRIPGLVKEEETQTRRGGF